ncbi:type II 3-dehydroquinate dehydratase [Leucobacter sp. Psy1]|uniref:type II 3-dehydroquinate dehydratase n=1 Tax=Leucobacter sp. Psy1 TaxID=2875729 RepID=UPI001CD25E04|nr:type II 3-dehydroquinate dehydratase [Leucobacter sp. Psy1]
MERPHILVLNGPNLNLLGTREPGLYGTVTLADVESLVRRRAEELGYDISFAQSNHEGELIDRIHAARGISAGVVINPGAYTHTSIAIRDALLGTQLPFVEVHVTNVHRRESFRHHSYLSDVAEAVLVGVGTRGWVYGIEIIAGLDAADQTSSMTQKEGA